MRVANCNEGQSGVKKNSALISKQRAGADPGEVKRVNFHPPFSEPSSFFFFLIPQILIGSNTLLQKFTPHLKILDPRLKSRSELRRFYSKTISSLLLPNQNTLETFKRTLI